MKFSLPYSQALQVSSFSQLLKIQAGRLSANMLSPVRTNLWQAKVRKQKVLAAVSCQEQKKERKQKALF